MQSDTITLTSKLGIFTFNRNTILSKAKLLRDSITGQFFSPRADEPRIKTEEDAYGYALHHLSNALAAIPFQLEIRIMPDRA